jgi:hypothetical protein
MPHKDASALNSLVPPENARRIWSIVNRLDQILTELDALNLQVPASHVSLGTELLREIRSALFRA